MRFTAPRLWGESGSGEFELRWEEFGGAGEVWVFLSGGPGESGVGLLGVERVLGHVRGLVGAGRLVGFDQRGTGEAGPVDEVKCVRIEWRQDALVESGVMFDSLVEQAVRTRAGWGEGFRAEMVTPWQSAQDLGALADALGVERVNLVGHSYGTHLAMAAMKAVPERVGDVVLLGFEGPGQTLKSGSQFDRMVDRVESEVDGFAGFGESLRGAVSRLEEPVDVGGVLVGEWGLRWMLASWLGLRSRLGLARDVCAGVVSGEFTVLEKAVEGFRKMLERRSAVYWLCDSASGVGSDRLVEIRGERGTLLGDAAIFPFPEIGAAWGQVDLGDWFRKDPVWERRVRVFTGRWDSFTPTSNFLEAGRGFSDVEHVEVPAFHDDLLLGWGTDGG